jgi:hypothetical protein
MRLILITLVLSFAASAAVVNGFVVSRNNANWAARSTGTFPEYWSRVSNEFHAAYGQNINTWQPKSSWRPFSLIRRWESKRDSELRDALDDLGDAVEGHVEGNFRRAQRNYNEFLENMFKADAYDRMSGCPCDNDYYNQGSKGNNHGLNQNLGPNYDQGYNQGYNQKLDLDYDHGYNQKLDLDYDQGYNQKLDLDYDQGYNQKLDLDYNQGYNQKLDNNQGYNQKFDYNQGQNLKYDNNQQYQSEPKNNSKFKF